MSESLTRRVNIYVNSGDAEKAYEKLEKSNARLTASEDRLIQKTKQLEQTLAGIDKNADPKAFRKATKDLEDMSKALDANRQAQTKNKTEMDTIQKKMSGEISASYNDMAKTVRRLSQELKNMSQSDVNFGSKLAELKQAKAEMNKFEESIHGGKKAYIDMYREIKSVAIGTLVAGGLTGLAGVAGTLLTGSADASIEREKKRRELQAITGVAEEELGVLDQYASELSRIELESGKAFNTSTNDIYEAFKLVGSAKPELLSNIDALKATTKEVLVLSKASGLDLSQSTRAVTSILNQFNMGAGESRRVINALAAGAKEGAKEIPWLTDAFEKVGPIAANSNMTIEQTIAALEVLGLSMDESSVAGNGLKNVILELQKEGYGKMADGTFNYAKAMQEVDQQLKNNVDVINVFGKESAVAALIAQKNTGEYERLSKALVGTSSAYDQASIQTIELEERQKEFSKALNASATALGQKLTPAMIWLYDAGMKTMAFFKENTIAIEYTSKLVGTLAAAYLYFTGIVRVKNAIVVAETFLENARAAAIEGSNQKTRTAIVLQTAWNAVTKLFSNPAIAATVAFGIVLLAMNKMMEETITKQKMLNDINKEAADKIATEKTEFQMLWDELKKTNAGSEERKRILTELNQKYPEYLQNMDLETANASQLATAYDKISLAMENKIRTEIAMDKKKALLEQKTKLEFNKAEKQKNASSTAINAVDMEQMGDTRSEYDIVTENYDKDIDKINKQIAYLDELNIKFLGKKSEAAKNINDANNKASATTSSAGGAGEKGSKPKITKDDIEKEEDNWNKRMQELRDEYYLANLTDDERELARIDTKYNKLVKEVDSNEKLLADTKRRYISELRNLEKTEKESTQNNIDYKAALAANDTYHEGLKQKAEESYALGTITHEQYTHEIELLDISLHSARLNLAHDYQDKAKQACADITKFEKEEQKKRVDDLKNATEKKIKAEEELKNRVEKFNLDQASYKASRTKDNKKDDIQAEINQIKYKYDQEIEQVIKSTKKIEDIEKEKSAALKGISDQSIIDTINARYQAEIDLANNNKEKIAQIEAEKAAEIKKIKDKAQDDTSNNGIQELEFAKKVADGLQEISNGVIQLMGAKADADLRREQRRNDAKKKHFKALLDSKRISQEQHDQLTQEADETMARKQAEIKRKQFEAEKTARFIGILIDTAAAVTRAILMSPETIGLPWSAIIAGNGAVQSAFVMSQQAPEFAKGADFDNNKLLQGPSHEQGGMAVVDSTGKKVAEFEGNELLLGKKFKENNPEWISTLLDLGRNGGRLSDVMMPPGLPRLTIADTMPSASRNLPQVSSSRVIENYKYKQGASFGEDVQSTATAVAQMPKEQSKAIEESVFGLILKKLESIDDKLNSKDELYKIDYERLGLELAKGLKRVKY